MRWEALGAGLFNPVAVSAGPHQLMLLARGSNNELMLREWSEGAWGRAQVAWPARGTSREIGHMVPVDWPLAACPSGGPWPHMVASGPDGELLHLPRGEGRGQLLFAYVGAPAALAGRLAIPMGLGGPPSACSPARSESTSSPPARRPPPPRSLGWPGLGRVRIARGPHTGQLRGIAALPAWRPGQLLQRRRPDSGLHARTRQRSANEVVGWEAVEPVGVAGITARLQPHLSRSHAALGTPHGLQLGPRRARRFARGYRGDMLHRSWEGQRWRQFGSLRTPSDKAELSVPFVGPVTACSWGEGRLDVLARATDGQLYHAWCDGSWEHG